MDLGAVAAQMLRVTFRILPFLLVDSSTIRDLSREIPVLAPQMIALYTDGGWE
jgi:hypothetical protein